MEVHKYNSIENNYRQEFIDQIRKEGHGDRTYVVQEKAHGANLSMITDGKTVRAARRTGLLEPDEVFYNYLSVVRRLESTVLELFKELAAQHSFETLTIFGELIGGGYPHPKTKKVEGQKLVQRGIYYAPRNKFYAFDILLDSNNFLDVETANRLFRKHDFLHAQTLFKGSLDDCLAYTSSPKTTIPEQLGLPPLNGNIAEGVVIRPQQPVFLNNGSRILVKNKNEHWSENNAQIDRKLLDSILREEASPAAEAMAFTSLRYISRNRLNNVISKLGPDITLIPYGKLLGMFNQDILTDLKKDYPIAFSEMEKQDVKHVSKMVNERAGKLVQAVINMEK